MRKFQMTLSWGFSLALSAASMQAVLVSEFIMEADSRHHPADHCLDGR
jgi:hypothetical protein